jgi:hypothetical protein
MLPGVNGNVPPGIKIEALSKKFLKLLRRMGGSVDFDINGRLIVAPPGVNTVDFVVSKALGKAKTKSVPSILRPAVDAT